jgi:putative acetyltransferase
VSGEVVVRTAAPDDAVAPVIRAAFEDEGEQVARLWAEVEQSDALRASIVAEQDGQEGQVVGHVGLSHAWLDARRELVDVWVLSPLSVLPAMQRQGIGARLLAAAIGEARSGGTPLLFLEGSPDFYGRRGFERASPHGFAPASVRTPDTGFQVVRFAGHEDWMTGQLIYRDVWWRHDAAGLRDPVLAQIETQIEQTQNEEPR